MSQKEHIRTSKFGNKFIAGGNIVYMYHGTDYDNWINIQQEGLKSTLFKPLSLAPDIETAEQYASDVTSYEYNDKKIKRKHGIIIQVKLYINNRYFKVNSERIVELQKVLSTNWQKRSGYFPEYLYYETILPKYLSIVKHVYNN